MTNYAVPPAAEDLNACTCVELGGCQEFDSPCPVCGERGAYDPCPALGFMCAMDGDAQPCECCTPDQFAAARKLAVP